MSRDLVYMLCDWRGEKLPIASADSLKELSAITGLRMNTLYSYRSNWAKGKKSPLMVIDLNMDLNCSKAEQERRIRRFKDEMRIHPRD